VPRRLALAVAESAGLSGLRAFEAALPANQHLIPRFQLERFLANYRFAALVGILALLAPLPALAFEDGFWGLLGLLPIVGMLAISAAYYWLDKNEASRWARFWVSAHGLFGAALYLLTPIFWWAIPPAYRPWNVGPEIFVCLYILPLASIAYALVRFKGPRWLHLSQVLNLAFMLLTFFATMIAGPWP